MRFVLRPNANGLTEIGGKPYQQIIEIASEDEMLPWVIIPADAFYWRDDQELHDRLVAGETVTVELVVVEP